MFLDTVKNQTLTFKTVRWFKRPDQILKDIKDLVWFMLSANPYQLYEMLNEIFPTFNSSYDSIRIKMLTEVNPTVDIFYDLNGSYILTEAKLNVSDMELFNFNITDVL